MRQMVGSTAAQTTAIGISWISVLMASSKWDILCGWNWYILYFTYLLSQKSIGVRSGDLDGHWKGKWREITLPPNCWFKRCLTEAHAYIHTTLDRAFAVANWELRNEVTCLDSEYSLLYTIVDHRQKLLQKSKDRGWVSSLYHTTRSLFHSVMHLQPHHMDYCLSVVHNFEFTLPVTVICTSSVHRMCKGQLLSSS